MSIAIGRIFRQTIELQSVLRIRNVCWRLIRRRTGAARIYSFDRVIVIRTRGDVRVCVGQSGDRRGVYCGRSFTSR
jgi:hypothetical protein